MATCRDSEPFIIVSVVRTLYRESGKREGPIEDRAYFLDFFVNSIALLGQHNDR